MEWKTIFEICLGNIQNSTLTKKARILKGTGIVSGTENENPKRFSLLRADIRICNDTVFSVGVSLSNTEFQWLTNILSQNYEHAKFTGKRILVLDKIDELNSIISSVDNEKVFGLILSKSEQKELLDYKYIFELFLKYHAATGNQIIKLLNELYTVHLASNIENTIKSDCNGCLGISDHNDNSYCTKYLKTLMKNKDYVSIALNSPSVECSFLIRFNSLFSFLEISPATKLECIQLTLPIIKADINKIIKEQIQYRDIGGSDANILAKALEKIEPIISASEHAQLLLRTV